MLQSGRDTTSSQPLPGWEGEAADSQPNGCSPSPVLRRKPPCDRKTVLALSVTLWKGTPPITPTTTLRVHSARARKDGNQTELNREELGRRRKSKRGPSILAWGWTGKSLAPPHWDTPVPSGCRPQVCVKAFTQTLTNVCFKTSFSSKSSCHKNELPESTLKPSLVNWTLNHCSALGENL